MLCEFQVSLNEQNTILTCFSHHGALGFVPWGQNCLLFFFLKEKVGKNKFKRELIWLLISVLILGLSLCKRILTLFHDHINLSHKIKSILKLRFLALWSVPILNNNKKSQYTWIPLKFLFHPHSKCFSAFSPEEFIMMIFTCTSLDFFFTT